MKLERNFDFTSILDQFIDNYQSYKWPQIAYLKIYNYLISIINRCKKV